MQYNVYLVLAPIAGVISIASVVLAWHGRKVTGFQSLIWLLLAVSGFLFSNPFELISPLPSGTFFWARASYLFVAFLPILWLAFTLEYTGHLFWLKLSRFWVFCLIPAATQVFVFYRPFLPLIWRAYTFDPPGGYFQVLKVLQYGPWFWVFVIYNYALILSGTLLVIWTYFQSNSIYRYQSRWMVVGVLLPLLGNAVYTFRLIPGLTKDFSPIAYTFAGLCFVIDIYRHQLLDLMPVARSTLFDWMSDGVIVVDSRQRIVDANPAAVAFIGQDRSTIIGSQAVDRACFWKEENLPGAGQETVLEVSSQRDERKQFHEVRILSLANKQGIANGYLVNIHENTHDKELLEQVEKLARIDPLTEVYNRRSLIELASQEVQNAIERASPISVIMLDLDYLKKSTTAPAT